MTRRSATLRPTRFAGALLALVVVAAAATVGCGVPIDSDPRAISRTTIDPDGDNARQTPTTSNSPSAREVSAYFMRGENLEARKFPVDGRPTLEDALAFAVGEPPGGLTTSIPSGTSILTVSVDGVGAVIDLTGDINDISGQTQKQAYAQLAFTTFAFGAVTEVRFMVDGKAVDAPTDNGNRAAVTQFDYTELRPEP